MGVRFPALKGFRPHGLTTRFWFFLTTYFGRMLSGWPHRVLFFCFSPCSCYRRPDALTDFSGDHIFIFEVWVLTTFLTIVRCGLHGNSSTREHENVRFCWQNSTKKHYLALEKHKNRSWGGRGRRFKSCHLDQNGDVSNLMDCPIFSLFINTLRAFGNFLQNALFYSLLRSFLKGCYAVCYALITKNHYYNCFILHKNKK